MVTMTSEIQNKDSTSVQKKKVRIGSPVPVENREWLKHHGIVTDQTLSSPGDIYSTRSTPPIFSFKRVIQTSITILLLVLPFAGYQYFQKMANELQNERERFKNLRANGN